MPRPQAQMSPPCAHLHQYLRDLSLWLTLQGGVGVEEALVVLVVLVDILGTAGCPSEGVFRQHGVLTANETLNI